MTLAWSPGNMGPLALEARIVNDLAHERSQSGAQIDRSRAYALRRADDSADATPPVFDDRCQSRVLSSAVCEP